MSPCDLSNIAYYAAMLGNMVMAAIWFLSYRRNARILRAHFRVKGERPEDMYDIGGKMAGKVLASVLRGRL